MNQRLRKSITLWIGLMAVLFAQGAWAQQISVNEFYRGGTLATDEFIEILLNQDLTAAQLESFYIGDGTSTVTTKFSAYRLTNMSSIASTFKAGTIIVMAGTTAAPAQDLSYNPAGGDWNITINTGGANAPNANTGNSGDLAATDVVWVDTAPTGSSVTSNGFAIKWTASTGSFVVNVGIPVPANNSGVSLTSNLAGAGTAASWVGQASTLGQPNGSSNTTYINGLRAAGSAPVATLTASPTTLTGYVATQGSVSNVQTYTLTGSNLNGNPVSVSATANIELSTTSGGTYTPTLSLPASASTISQTIYARITSAAPTSPFSGTITNTANGTLTASVTVSGQVNAVNAPALSATPTTLSGFSTPQGTVSAAQSYTLTAANLTAAISVSAPAGVEVSQTMGSGFSSSLSFPQSTASAVVYARLTGAALGPVTGTITNISGSLTANVAVSGAVSSTAPYTLISQIQGSGTAFNPTFGGTQTIEGIVTRTFFGATRLNGFYLQEEDADSDNNPATSEGIFVFDQSGLFAGNVGDKIRVTGAISEFSGATASLTEITLTSFVPVSTGNALPTIPNVQLPVANVSDLERYEGMLVNMSAASGNLAVTEYFQLGRFGQVLLSSTGATDQPGTDPRLDQYTQFFAPSVSGYAAYLADTDKRQIYLDDGSTVQNPASIIFGRGGQPLSASNTLRGGDQVSSITAILDERLEGYRLQTTTGVNFQPTNPRPTTPPVVGGTLKAGSFNVLNYFTTFGTGNFTNCAGNAIGGRGADNAAEFTRQRDKIIQAIVTSGVDVMGLNEIQNNGFGSNSAIQDLVNGLNAAAGANSYTYVNSGCISTDAITVAMIYKPAKVTPVGSSTAIPFNYGNGAFGVVGRRALAQTFQQTSTGGIFTLVANHWKSKGSSSGGAGDADANDGQSASNGTRTRQAQDLVSWLATNPTGTTDPDYLIVGDLNAYAKENPLTTLEQNGYTNLVPATTYSYVFDGFVGALDHALRSASLQSQIAGADKWHINSDEPSVLDYNTNFKTADQVTGLYSPEPYRASDHDPVLIGLNLVGPTTPVALNINITATPATLLTTGSTTLSATVSGGTTPYSYTFSGPGTITTSGNTASVSSLSAGVQTFTVVARDATTPTSQTISATVSVTVTMAPPVNQAPVVANAISPQSATVGQGFSYVIPANTFSDPNNDALTLSVSGLPAGLNFTAPATISGTPSTTVGSPFSVTVTATDPGNLSARTTFTITVSPAPVVVTSLSITVSANPTTILTTGSTTLSATVSGGTTPYSYTFSGPGTITTSGNTASVSSLSAGVQTFTIVARDATTPTSQTISATVSVTVTAPAPVNMAPVVANAIPAQSATVGQGFSYVIPANTFSDPNNDALTLSVSGLPQGLSFTPPATISGTPSVSGTSTVTVTATDPGNLSVSTTFTITVSPAASMTGTAPFAIAGVTTVSCSTISAGQRVLSFSPQYAGLNGSPVSFSVVNELAPTTDAGPYTLTLFTDNPVITLKAVQSGVTASFAYNWLAVCGTNTPPPANQAPTVANPIPAQNATVGQGFSYVIPASTFTDPNNDALTLSVIGLPAGLNFTPPATISGTPSVSGTSTVTVTATDPGNLSVSTTFTITVSPAASMTGTAPFAIAGVTTVSCSTISAGQRVLSFSPQYAGLNGSPVSFSVVNELAPTTNAGPYTLTLFTDNPVINLRAVQSGVTASFAYNWLAVCGTNTPPPANQAPTVANPIPAQNATVGQGFSYVIPASTFTDPNNDALTLSVIGLPAGLNFAPPATISGTPSVSGTSTVTVTATDPGNLSVSTTFTITVSPAASMTGTAPFAIAGVTTVSCSTISAGQRVLSFSPQYAGLNGSPVSFSVVNELAATTQPGPYTLSLYTDNPVITLKAVQSGTPSSFAYNWLVACNGGNARMSAEPTVTLKATLYPNPVSDEFSVRIGGAAGKSVQLLLTDLNGHTLTTKSLTITTDDHQEKIQFGQYQTGLYLLRVSTGKEAVILKVIKQ